MSELRRILLVEDSPRDAEMTIQTLTDHHLANGLVHCRDGAEALDFLFGREGFAGRAVDAPAVILLDLKMPKIDGLEVLRVVKGHPMLKLIPVVIMTSSREEQDLVRSYQLGVNAYVVKPVRFAELVDAVRQLGIFWAVLNEVPRTFLPDSSDDFPQPA